MIELASQMWTLVESGSNELAGELELEGFGAESALDAIDQWLTEAGELDEEDVARLGLLLARVLIENHGGGLTQIGEAGHPLAGEWAITDFQRGLPPDYHVPFLVSAARIALDRSLGARAWYKQILDEARRS